MSSGNGVWFSVDIRPMQMSFRDAPWLVPATALFAAVAAAGVAALSSNATVADLLREGGSVETASALLHFAAAALALVLCSRALGLPGLIAVCAFLMGARELDLHQAFTTHGIFSTKQYFRDTVPMAEKLLGGAVALTLIALLATRIAASVRDVSRLVSERSAAVIGLVTIAVVVPLLALLDAAPRLGREAGLAPSPDLVTFLLASEELGELALPVIIMLVTLQVAHSLDRRGTKARQTSSATDTVAYMESERRTLPLAPHRETPHDRRPPLLQPWRR